MAQTKRILIAVMLSCFLGPFMGSSINVAIPAMVVSFKSSPEAMTWAVTAFLIGAAAALLPFGSLSDLKGRRKVYFIGLLFTCISTLVTGMMSSYVTFIAWRFIQGVSMSMIFGTGMALLVSCYPAEKRGRIIGLASSCVYIGLSVGPFLGGLITEYLNWHFIFYITGAALLVDALLIMTITEDWYGNVQGGFDYLGAFLASGLVFLFLYSISTWSTHPYIHYIILLCIIFFVLFVKQQLKTDYPLIDLKIFRNRIFTQSNFAALIHYSATFAIAFLMSLYLQYIRGLDAAATGLFLLIQPSFMTLFSPITGILSDKYQPRYLCAFGMLFMLSGLSFFHFFLTATTPFYLIAANLAVIGFGFAFFAAPNNNAIMSSVSRKVYGVASSVLAVVRLVGQALSMAIVTMVLSTHVTSHHDPNYPQELLGTLNIIFLVLAFLCFLGFLASLFQPSLNNKEEGI